MTKNLLIVLITISLPLTLMAQAFTKLAPVITKPVVSTPIVTGPIVTIGPKCNNPTEENCLAETDLGNACRKKYPEQCKPSLTESLQEEVNQVNTIQTTIAPFSLSQSGNERSALVKDAPKVNNLNISGMSATFQALQIPANIGKYKMEQFGSISSVSAATSSAITSSPALASSPAVTSTPAVVTTTTSTVSTVPSVASHISIPATIVHKPIAISKIKLKLALDRRERWANQAGFESCEEFVHERFRNLSTLEEKASTLRNDPVAIFNFIRSRNWLNHNYFIPQYSETGRLFIGNWIADPEWRPYHNNPILKSLDQNGNWHKNAFASYNISRFYESTIDRNLVDLVSRTLNTTTELTLENQLSMASQLAAENISTEYLEQMQDLGRQYLAKLEERIATYAEYTKAKSDADYICLLPPRAGGGQSNCDYAQQKAAEKLVEIKARLIPIDQEITNMLTLANNVGCFDSNNIKCDWAPSVMLKTLDWGLHKYKKRREEEFDMCNLALKSQLTSESNQYVVPQDDYKWIIQNPNYKKYFRYPNKGWMWKRYPQDFIKFIQFAWQYYEQVQAELKEVKKYAQIDHPTLAGKKQVGNLKADNGFYGTDMLGGIGAGYAYTAGWLIKDYERDVYRANVESFSSFALHALVFGKEFDIVDYTGDTKTTHSRSLINLRLKILDKNWVAPYGKNESSGYRFVINSIQEKKVFSKHKYINVFGVPIRLEAGAYAGAGFKSDLTNSFSRSSSDDSIQLTSLGSFQPYSALTAYASAAVDAVVARIGVRGRIDLLTLGLPLEVNHQIYKRQPDYLSALTTDTKLGIELGTLSGRFSAFMDTIFGDLEHTLFRWKGLSFTHNLFKAKTDRPFALKYARQSLGIQQ